jgi:hypothetical protein
MKLPSHGGKTGGRSTRLHQVGIGFCLALCLTGTPLNGRAQTPTNPEPQSLTALPSQHRTTFGVFITVKPLPPGTPSSIPRWLCPSPQYVLLPLTSEYCLQPDGGTCTWHSCYDNKTHKQVSAVSNPPGQPNPVCTQVPKPCSNDVSVPEKFVPTRRQLVEMLPGLFPPGLERAPIVGPGKP